MTTSSEWGVEPADVMSVRKNVAAAFASFTWQDFTGVIVQASGITEPGDVEG